MIVYVNFSHIYYPTYQCLNYECFHYLWSSSHIRNCYSDSFNHNTIYQRLVGNDFASTFIQEINFLKKVKKVTFVGNSYRRNLTKDLVDFGWTKVGFIIVVPDFFDEVSIANLWISRIIKIKCMFWHTWFSRLNKWTLFLVKFQYSWIFFPVFFPRFLKQI